MPYLSRAQQGLFHSQNSPVSPAVVQEFDNASRGQTGLPYHVNRPAGRPAPPQRGSRQEALRRALLKKGRRV